METEGTALGKGKFEIDLSELHLDRELSKYKLFIIIKFKSLLGRDWTYEFVSAYLINEGPTYIIKRSGLAPHLGPDFKLIKVIPPWVKR